MRRLLMLLWLCTLTCATHQTASTQNIDVYSRPLQSEEINLPKV